MRGSFLERSVTIYEKLHLVVGFTGLLKNRCKQINAILPTIKIVWAAACAAWVMQQYVSLFTDPFSGLC